MAKKLELNEQSAAVLSLAGTGIAVGLAMLALRTIRYELHEDALCVVIGGQCVRRILYSDIESVERSSPLWNEHWNRLALDPNITIRRRSGLIKNFVINPPNTDEFITQLRERIGK
ncbi:MAG TPA: PH domain-containing protein [Abditibacteriaceae bacterium]